MKLCIEAPGFLFKCIEALCWSSKLFFLVCWSFTLKLLGVSSQLVCWSFVLRFKVLCFGALKICVEAPSSLFWCVEALRSLVNLCVETLCWNYKASSWHSRCFEGFRWSYASSIVSVSNLSIEASHYIVNVLTLYVDGPRF